MHDVPQKQLQRNKPWGRRLEQGEEGTFRPAAPPEEPKLATQPLAAPDPFETTLPPFLENNEHMREGFLRVATFVKQKRREGLRPLDAYEAAVKFASHFPELEAARQRRKVPRITKGFTAGMELALNHYKVYADQVS